MDYKDRKGNIYFDDSFQDKILSLLYTKSFGRLFLKLLTVETVSKTAGKLLETKLSGLLVKPFVMINKINMSDYPTVKYKTFNDFFTRKITPEKRPIDYSEHNFISPCDSNLLALKLTDNAEFIIKNSKYSVYSLLRDKCLASIYKDGLCLIFRLSVENYHRYCYVDNLKKTKNRKIKGIYHTVKYISGSNTDIYKENTREYTYMETENFGKITQVEIGALFVGRINNHHDKGEFKKGQEKGMFEFGGSTIVLLIEKDKVLIDDDIIKNTEAFIETTVKAGEKIGISK